MSCFGTGLVCNYGADPRLRFAKTFDQNMIKHIDVKKADFHTALFKAVLEAFTVPATVYRQLEKILTTMGENIAASKDKTKEKQQYWLMFTRYEWQPEVEDVESGECKSKDPKR